MYGTFITFFLNLLVILKKKCYRANKMKSHISFAFAQREHVLFRTAGLSVDVTFSIFITSANVFAGFCLFVCLSVSQQDNSKSYGQIFLKFWMYVGHGIYYKCFNFGRDPTGILNSGLLWNFCYYCVKGGIREPLQNRRWWRHLENSIALAEVPADYDCFLVLTMHLSKNKSNSSSFKLFKAWPLWL